MRKLTIIFQLIIVFHYELVLGQCSVSSTDGYVVHMTLIPQSVIAPGSCPGGYNYNINLSYNITFTGTNIPGSLWTLQGTLTCGSDNLFIPLSTSGGSGTVATTSNPYNTNTDCATATVSSLNCNAISVNINGPGIPSQNVNCTYNSGPLPIELMYFNAFSDSDNNKVGINWSTASEINNNYFTVERSTDGINFTTIRTITSKGINGNSAEILSYTISDSNIISGVYYYRLKQTDFDFKCTYSNVVSVTITQNVDFEFDVAPNPNDGASMQGFITSPYNGMVTFKVYDIGGNRLYLENVAISEGRKHPFEIQFKDRLNAGTYIVICILNEDLTRKKLMFVRK